VTDDGFAEAADGALKRVPAEACDLGLGLP
jgi:hypothetical protein